MVVGRFERTRSSDDRERRARHLERVAAGDAQLVRLAAEDLRQRQHDATLFGIEAPADRRAVEQRIVNLGSRPGAHVGLSKARRANLDLRLLAIEQLMIADLAAS